MYLFVHILSISFIFIDLIVAYKYVVSVNDDLGPCRNDGPYIDKYLDISNLRFTKDDDVLIVDGNVTMLADLDPNGKVNVRSSYFRKQHGDWMPLPMANIIPDFCAVQFSQAEIWYPAMNQLKGDARKCPPPKGTVFSVNKAELVGRYEFAKTVEGEYLAEIECTFDKFKVCFSMSAEVKEDLN